MKTRLLPLLIGAVLIMSGSPAIGASDPVNPSSARSFSNCTTLNRTFRYGVAKSRAAANFQVSQGNGRPAVNRAVYFKNNSRLDRDNDGTACERS